ncbi:hypothetical protein H6G45_15190 [Synechocystis sp. FACHB-383]|uniref:hypothetical protein n=1 Tax=Synechocystis sp. FACHB-383 TaxID=2692864 RepID=UPI001684C0CF|nr:hypothetical protein [Synechocystis sp. FACHB-383]MBD2654803.1 hypothetical protein [Synechocystis sp. FACHB-383]
MKPEFATVQAWEQADCLMQPALIRTIDHLRQGLESCPWRSRYEEVEEPIPGHRLILENEGQTYGVNIWDLCFQVCFANYQPQPFGDQLPDEDEVFTAEIDQQLFNDQGEVDWTKLDDKARHCVTTLLAALPTVGQS